MTDYEDKQKLFSMSQGSFLMFSKFLGSQRLSDFQDIFLAEKQLYEL